MSADRILKLQAGLNGTPVPVGAEGFALPTGGAENQPLVSDGENGVKWGTIGSGLSYAAKIALLDVVAAQTFYVDDPALYINALANALDVVYVPRYKGIIGMDQVASRVGFEVLSFSADGTPNYNSSENIPDAVCEFKPEVQKLTATRGKLPFLLVFKKDSNGAFYSTGIGGGGVYKLTPSTDHYERTSSSASAAGIAMTNPLDPAQNVGFSIELTDGVLTMYVDGAENPMVIEGANVIGFSVRSGYFGYSCATGMEAF